MCVTIASLCVNLNKWFEKLRFSALTALKIKVCNNKNINAWGLFANNVLGRNGTAKPRKRSRFDLLLKFRRRLPVDVIEKVAGIFLAAVTEVTYSTTFLINISALFEKFYF